MITLVQISELQKITERNSFCAEDTRINSNGKVTQFYGTPN